MKTHKINLKSEEFSIDRKTLARIGDSLYHNSEVAKIDIKITFKDRTKLEYFRSEFADEIERQMIHEEENGEEDE
jgi:hypothetical protein